MKMIFVLIILALILLCVAIVVFFWAVKQRQFDDLDVHAYSVLTEDNFEKISTIDSPNTVESTSKTPE
ncbi:MAG: cbb3-type cytochrome oxidase maturation protein [Cocleimonas sp.]|jgi:cbb3-type cytochrome oxidase maturation protein